MESEPGDAATPQQLLCAGTPIARRKHYSIRTKRIILTDSEGMSEHAAAKAFGVPRRTFRDWRANKENIFAFQGSEKILAQTTGVKELIPFPKNLIVYIKDVRRADQVLTITRMAQFIKSNHGDWLIDYNSNNTSTETAYDSLFRLLRRFAYRHGLVQRTPHGLKENREDLLELQKTFSETFKKSYGCMAPNTILNVDETGVYYDTPPSRILCAHGEPSNISVSQKHSACFTVVCTIRGDGKKLPLIFILRGEPEGTIATDEVPIYPKGHYYAVQRKAWMDGRVWSAFLRSVLLPEIEAPSVLLVDNLDCHVSAESEEIVAGELFSYLQPLP